MNDYLLPPIRCLKSIATPFNTWARFSIFKMPRYVASKIYTVKYKVQWSVSSRRSYHQRFIVPVLLQGAYRLSYYLPPGNKCCDRKLARPAMVLLFLHIYIISLAENFFRQFVDGIIISWISFSCIFTRKLSYWIINRSC